MEDNIINNIATSVNKNKAVLKPLPIYHVFPVNDDSLNHEEFIFSEDLSEIDFYEKLKSYNDKWYNIYKTFNTFVGWKRDTESVFEFKGILIDLDYTQEDKEDYISILSHCNKIKKKYGIFPVEINETFKWYHLIYALSEDLMFINNELYLELSKILVGEFNADYNAKQITWLYKVHWFIDHKKDWVSKKWRNFKIINKYNHPKNRYYEVAIQENNVRQFHLLNEKEKINDFLRKVLFWKRIYWNKMMKWLWMHEKAEAFLSQHAGNLKQKEMKKKRYNLLIESIDARVWIDDINNAYSKGKPWFDKPIVIKKDWISIDNTSWLKLYFNQNIWRYQIKDFSKWTRYWNKNFLFTYYFNIKNLNKKQQKLRAIQYMDFISKHFWIYPQTNLTKIAVNEKILHDYVKWKIFVDNEWIMKDIGEGVFNKIVFDTEYKTNYDWFKFYFLMLSYIQSNNIRFDDFWNYELDFSEFVEFTGYWSWTYDNKTIIKEILSYINRLYIVHTFWKIQKKRLIAKTTIINNIIYVTFNIELYTSLSKTPKTKIAYLNIGLWQFAKKKNDYKKTLFAMNILYGISSFRSVKMKITGVNSLWYSLWNTKRLLTEMKNKKFINDFYIKNNYVHIGDKKYLVSIWKRNMHKKRKKKVS